MKLIIIAGLAFVSSFLTGMSSSKRGLDACFEAYWKRQVQKQRPEPESEAAGPSVSSQHPTYDPKDPSALEVSPRMREKGSLGYPASSAAKNRPKRACSPSEDS